MKNKIDDLRNHLFATLEALQDTDKPMELDRARTIVDVSKAIIDSARAETERLEVAGAMRAATDFIPAADATLAAQRIGAGTAQPGRPLRALGHG